MKQSVMIERRRSETRSVPIPAVPEDGVLVKVRASGVCASELHTWEDGDEFPLRLGHEVAGEVVAVGAGVRDFRKGDRVTGLFHEGFAEYAVAPVDRVLPIPDDISYEAAFGEPLACAVSGARRTRVELGDRVAIVGLGFMGTLMLQLIRLKGPVEILGIDLRADARRNGEKFGCTTVAAPERISVPERQSFDVVIEATGTQDGLSLATLLTREHGVLSILGYHQGGPRSVDMKLWNFRALEVLNAHERRPDYRMDCMRRGLALAAAGRIELNSLPTHCFSLDEVDRGFAALSQKPENFIKSVIVDGPAPDDLPTLPQES